MPKQPTVAFLQMLIGNPAVYALQNSKGVWGPVREPLTAAVLRNHLSHKLTVGTYVVKGDQARTLVFDIDDEEGNTMDMAMEIRKGLLSYGVSPGSIGIEFSGKKGHHVWYVLQRYVDASLLRRLGQAVALLADFKGEVFPKQDKAVDLGNLVKLPGGLHRVSDKENNFVKDFVPVPEYMSRWTQVEAMLPPPVTARSAGGEAHSELDRYPCMEACQNEGARTGSRNIELLQLAVMLRRGGLTPENVALVLAETNLRGDPVDEREFENILASSEKTGPICSQLPADRQCGELCVSSRGLRPWPGRVLRAAEGEGVVLTLVGRTEAGTAIFEHPDTVEVRGRLR